MNDANFEIGVGSATVVWSFLIVILSAGCPGASSVTDDDEPLEKPEMAYQAVPFERVGPITADSTRRELVEEFGGERLDDIETSVGRQGARDATRVTLDSSPMLEVVWSHADPPKPEMIRVLDARVRTAEGIGLGTTLQDLQQILGEFQVSGFEISVPGRVSLHETELDDYSGGLELQLEATNTEGDHYRNVAGAQRIPASDPDLRAVEPVVSKMVIVFE